MMKVGELLQKIGQTKVFSIQPTASAKEASELMKSNQARSLVVLDDEDRLRGIITETDIDKKVNLEGLSLSRTKVGQIMTPLREIVLVDLKTEVEECRDLMKKYNVRHLPVVRDGDIAEGVISTTDLAIE